MLKVKIINSSTFDLPQYATQGAAGLDLQAFIHESLTIEPSERKLVPTGLFLEIPEGYEAQIRPRSGLAFKKGLSIPNAPGTIDSDYRGELNVIIINLSNTAQTIEPGERIAQLIFAKVEQVAWEVSDQLNKTHRGSGGFGSTGS